MNLGIWAKLFRILNNNFSTGLSRQQSMCPKENLEGNYVFWKENSEFFRYLGNNLQTTAESFSAAWSNLNFTFPGTIWRNYCTINTYLRKILVFWSIKFQNFLEKLSAGCQNCILKVRMNIFWFFLEKKITFFLKIFSKNLADQWQFFYRKRC